MTMDAPYLVAELGTPPDRGAFSTTHWSVVLEAGQEDSPEANEALERLCQSYWYPLYTFVRRQGYSPEDAQDLTQGFFARFLEHKYVALASRNRGKFRTFLLTSLRHFLVNEWEKARAEKRGGWQTMLTGGPQEAEDRYLAELDPGLAPDKIYEKRWAISLLETTLANLRQEFSAAGKGPVFEALKIHLWGGRDDQSYTELGAELGMTEGAVKVAVHRLRQRYRELLRAEIAHTVATPAEVDEELRYLVSVIRS
jgi:RNA polymerase sigma factor (sigma-70 family)